MSHAVTPLPPSSVRRELNRALLLNGTFLRKRQLVKLMKQFDDDGNGTLDFEVNKSS
jgi:hypothetical protein